MKLLRLAATALATAASVKAVAPAALGTVDTMLAKKLRSANERMRKYLERRR